MRSTCAVLFMTSHSVSNVRVWLPCVLTCLRIHKWSHSMKSVVDSVSSMCLTPKGDSLVMVIALRILINSIKSPQTSNVVREPLFFAPLHADGDNTPGCGNLGAELIGKRFGIAVDTWLCRWLWVPVATVTVCIAFESVMQEQLGLKILVTSSELFLAVPFGLCLRLSVVKQLARRIGVYYYIVSFVTARVLRTLIFGPRFWTSHGETDWTRASAYCAEAFSAALALVAFLPFIDAVPDRIASRTLKLWCYILLVGFNGHFYISSQLKAPSIYSTGL